MAVGAFPFFKLGFLVVKQISKPIANSIAKRAKKSRVFREWICIPVAQLFHWYDVQIRMKMLNLGKARSVPKLNEDNAIETGSQLLSEFILLSVGAAILFLEYQRQSGNEEAKAERLAKEKAALDARLADLEFGLEEQRAQLRELTRLAHAINDKRAKNATDVAFIYEEDRPYRKCAIM